MGYAEQKRGKRDALERHGEGMDKVNLDQKRKYFKPKMLCLT